jgi:ankyrin repeat protein
MKSLRIKYKFTIIVPLMLLSSLIFGCGKSEDRTPDQARLELAKMNIKYSEASFIDRVKEGDSLAVKLFLLTGMSPNAKDEQGGTALIWAIIKGNTIITIILIEKGADPNALATYSQISPLLRKEVKSFSYLVNNANVFKSANFVTALSCVIVRYAGKDKLHDREKLVSLFLERGANPNLGAECWRPLLLMVDPVGVGLYPSDSDMKIIKLLLEKKADPSITIGGLGKISSLNERLKEIFQESK